MEIAFYASIGVLAGVLVALVALVALVYRVLVYLHEYGTVAASFMTAPDSDTPSPLQALIGGLGASVATSGRMAQLGQDSGDARMDLGARSQVIEAFARNKNPMLAQLADQVMPGWPRKVAKNPAIITQLMTMVQPGGPLAGFFKSKDPSNNEPPQSDMFAGLGEIAAGLGSNGDQPNG